MQRGSLSPEQWNVIEPLLDAALDLPQHERAPFLNEACGSDSALRGKVLALLDACERSDGMLAAPASVLYSPLLKPSEFVPPEIVGERYQIVRELGKGGMATVYLADDPKHARQVAVKIMHPMVVYGVAHDRFIREIEFVARLSHPHILPLHDSGEIPPTEPGEPPLFYFVAPYVTGESLRERLRRTHLPTLEEAVRLAREVALALDYAHRQGVMHLDVKPANILLQDGHAVIADFGIARLTDRVEGNPTLDGALVAGTPSYMSPEQAANAASIDGRSDIYSLGCVLREMVHNSAALDEVIKRATAHDPNDRFETAGLLANALAEAVPSRRTSSRRALMAIAAVAVLAISWAAYGALNSNSLLDNDLIAVAPFDVEAPTLSMWQEGLVDVMSRNLDGAGALRTVPATIVVRKWSGHADRQSVQALATRTGARLILFGGLIAAGDSVRLTAEVYDAKTGRTLAEFEHKELADRMDRLSDSLTVAVLQALGQARRIGLARATSSPTASLTALKLFLQGEQFYRAARWDSAQTRFERALALDSAFAMAYHRLAAVLLWRSSARMPDSSAFVVMRRASYFPRGLAPRERLLANADSLSAESYFAWRQALLDGNYATENALVRRLLRVLDDGVARDPNDPELWYLMAEAHSRFDNDIAEGEADERALLALYDRAISLDSAFAPAYVAPIALAGYLDGAESARRYIKGYLALEPLGAHASQIRLADQLLDPRQQTTIDIGQLVDTLPADGLCEVSSLLRHLRDNSKFAVRFAQALSNWKAPSGSLTSPLDCAFENTVDALQFRGRLRDAQRVAQKDAHGLATTVNYNLARTGIAPVDSSRAKFNRILSMSARTQLPKLYGWWATDRDTAAIGTYIKFFQRSAAKPHTASGASLLRSYISAGEAFHFLARGDTSAALKRLLVTKDTLNECWYDSRMEIARLLVASGRYQEAATRMERRWPGTSRCGNGFDDVLWTLLRARAFERVGRRAEAAASYAFVADAWQDADAELQTLVRESRTALTRLKP